MANHAVSVALGGLKEGRPAFHISDAYRRYVLILLLLVAIFNFVDRQIFAVLLESIKKDFSLTDTELGMLGGVAFAVFYSLCGIPIAWLADRSNRRNIIAIALCLWSAMTAICGLTTGFVSLFLARVGVGIGEAGGTPPANSIIADYFPPERRATAMAVIGMSVPLGVLTGFLVGGWVNEFLGWRSAFMVVGLPGVALAIVLWFTLREPPRGFYEPEQAIGSTPSILDTFRYLWQRPSCRHLCMAAALYGMSGWGAGIWQPSFFMRSHGMSSGEAGTWLAFVFGISGACGAMFGGMFGDRLVKKTQDARWYLWLSSGGILIAIPFVFLVYLWPTPIPALLFLSIPTFFGHMYLGPVMAMLLGIAGARRRALASSIYGFFVNLVAMGFGPLSVGMASDYLQPKLGSDSLRYAILAVVVISTAWAALHFLLATKSIRQDLAAVDQRG
ncbi:MAG TPA: MFS transporter [Gammaproteobacteria bacterium]|nr:MFS transporter [Gammaproteobacteria bacterium]